MLQLCAYWASVKVGRIGLPTGADEVRVFGRPEPGAELRIIGLLKNASGEVLASGFRALNSDPRCSEADLRANMESTGRAVAHRLEDFKYLLSFGIGFTRRALDAYAGAGGPRLSLDDVGRFHRAGAGRGGIHRGFTPGRGRFVRKLL